MKVTREQAQAVKARVEGQLIALEGVTGIDTRLVREGSYGIRVFAERDHVDSLRLEIPSEIDGVPVEIVVRRFRLNED